LGARREKRICFSILHGGHYQVAFFFYRLVSCFTPLFK
jgi:hypothetical protein